MNKKLTININRYVLKWSILSVVVFSLIAHGYRFSNNMYSHDSLLMIYQNDFAWQIALGRFIQPILIFFRGSLCNPWLISACAIFWTILSVYYIAYLLKIDQLIGIILTSGVFVCNTTVMVANASYLPWVDFYALACFLSIFGVWCCRKGIQVFNQTHKLTGKMFFWYLLGVLSFACSMGIYQSYICVAIGLVILDLLENLLEQPKFNEVLKKTISYLLCLGVSAVVYYLTWKWIQKIFHIWTANSYNGLASVGDYSDTSIITITMSTYKQVFDFLWYPETYKSLIYRNYSISYIWQWILRLANLFIVGFIMVRVFMTNQRKKIAIWNRVLQIILLVIFPFGINFVSFISKGMEHTLMIFAFSLIYILALLYYSNIFDANSAKDNQFMKEKEREVSISGITKCVVFVIPFFILIWNNVVYANQVYLKKELQAEATESLMTRVVSDIEDMEAYIPGQTSVAFYGNFQTSEYVKDITDFEDIVPYGMGKSSVTYIGADYSLLRYVLNVNMNLTRVDTTDDTVMKEIEAMPCYPEQGSICYIDDTLVVKIAEF